MATPSVQLASSPPSLPIVRQPSPLSFSVTSGSRPSSPASRRPSYAASSVSSHAAVEADSTPGPSRSTQVTPNTTPPRSLKDAVPHEPSGDSILYRSTLAHLESSSTTLKRLSKSVLAHTSLLVAALEAVERAEEQFLQALGELGRYIENGYGVPGDIWGDEGLRKVRRRKWSAERDEVRGMVEQGVLQVKGDLKRWGLAGGGSQAKFERATKLYYEQTSSYLSEPSNQPASEQSARAAAFDLARYTHHSTLLYAVPPSSISCLDLLVNIYGWVGGVLVDPPREGVVASSTPTLPKADTAASPARMKEEVATSLSKLAGVRLDLLDGWNRRNAETARLEDLANRPQPPAPAQPISSSSSRRQAEKPLSPVMLMSPPISSTGVEYKKHAGKIHKLHRSVGGKLRDLLGSSGSSRDIAGIVGRRDDQYVRNSIDVAGIAGRLDEADEKGGTSSTIWPVPPPRNDPSTAKGRPPLQSRHSIQITPDSSYLDPALFPFPTMASGPTSIPASAPAMAISRSLSPVPVARSGESSSNLACPPSPETEDVGRKKEGVLWGAGTWEEVGRGGKVKWEKLWVVLDHSSIYEYRDTDFDKREGAAMIDLKFASVREGRGTDRRFVFEVVTPTQGRRLYQATSEVELQQWVHAICNAIESVIQGTSSVRTFDTSKLRTISGAYDDHAVPVRQKLGFPIPGIQHRSGMLPSIPGSPSRRSMPPSTRMEDGLPRRRQTSFKRALRQSAEISERWKDAISPKMSNSDSRHSFLAPQPTRMNSSASNSAVSISIHPSDTPLQLVGKTVEDTPQPRTPTPNDSPDVSWYEVDVDGEIEKRVMEMAGLGLGFSPNSSPSSADRRVRSEGRGVLSSGSKVPPAEIIRSRSADNAMPRLDMEVLRKTAGTGQNTLCADCGKSTKASRWATISLRETPMVMFICIRCCGIHRSFGTHISKPRSVDLDIWTPDNIALALEWGNARGNAVWEAVGDEAALALRDDDIAQFMRQKYVHGRFLPDDIRARYGLEPRGDSTAGTAILHPFDQGAIGTAR